ncbi:MAG TPA: TatD family deoxyribonuclease [Chloroflexi bacterium]|nr:TatD family deoxyribonuclease [Chloroflexota bacterium]
MFIDAHAHVDRYDIDGLLDFVLAEIDQRRILTISNAMDLPSYHSNLESAERCRFVLPIFGVHPWNAPQYAGRLDDLRAATEQSPMIGEIGLDHFFVEDPSTYPAQREVFEYFLEAAKAQDKIVHLHTKGAEAEILALLDRYDLRRVIVHWYSGPLDVLREMIDRGFYFTAGIEALHEAHVREIAREIPSERLLTETDNPGGPKAYVGGPGMPGLIQDVVRGLAEIRGVTAKAIERSVEENLRALLHHDQWLPDTYKALLYGTSSRYTSAAPTCRHPTP